MKNSPSGLLAPAALVFAALVGAEANAARVAVDVQLVDCASPNP